MNKEDLGLELNNNSVNIETTPEYVDMDKLSLSAPVEFLSKYNSPKEWILDQDEAERVKVFTQPANREVGTLEKIEYGLGNVGYNVGRAVPEITQLGLGLASGVEKTIFPNSTETALDRLYKDVAISNAKNRERRENIVAGFTGGDSSIVKWSDAIGELGLFLGTAGVGAGIGANVARRGIQKLTTETAKGVATSPSVVRRAASVAATRGARKGQIAATLGTTFTQEGGSSAVDKVRQYIEETGDTELKNYNPTADTLTALSVGAINSVIEVGFGVERFIPEFWGTGTNFNRAARRFVEGALGEGVEEFAQDLTSQIGDIVNGYREDIDWGQAWDNAIVGGVLGGAAGSTMYYLNRRRMARKISNDYGIDYKKAASIVDDMLGTGIERTTNELSAQTELATEQGQAWDKLVNGVKTAMKTVDFADETSRNNQATAFAKTNVPIAMRLARKSGLSTDEFLDVAEFGTMNNGQNLNMVFIKPLGTVADIDKRIAAQDEIIERQKELRKTGAGDNNVLNRAKQRKAILQKAKAIKQYNDKQYKEQLKAQTTPELAKEIETATKDAEVVKELPTQVDFGAKIELENLTSAEKSRRYGNAVLKSILPTKTDFDAVMVDPMYANAKQAIIAVADRINSFIKAHRTYSLKTDITNALKKMQTVNKGNFIDSVTTPDLDGVDVIAENAFLYHFLFSDATTIQTYLDSYITRAEDSLNQKKGKLSKKDLVGQSFKATDNAMQTQAQVIGAEYTSIYNEDGSYADKNVMAVMLSYQNQFVQEQGQQIPPQMLEQFDLADENARLDDIYPAYDGETIEVDGKERTVYNSNGDRIAKSKEALTNFWRWFGDSKVVDEQGRPLVVYHGALGHTNLTEISPEYGFNVKAVYASDNKNISTHYAQSSYIKRDIADTKNKIEDAKTVEDINNILKRYGKSAEVVESFTDKNGAYYRLETGLSSETLGYKISDTEYQTPNGRKTDLLEKLKKYATRIAEESEVSDLYPLYMSLQNPLIVDANKKSFWKIDFEGKTTNTETIVETAKERNYDGVIVKNVYETDYENVLGNDYIAFKSNQIKSVDNRGTYSADTGNILYQHTILSDPTKTYKVKTERQNAESWLKKQDLMMKTAKEFFGTTTDWREAGYILPDGSLLDLSGANYGGTHDGTRKLDHRDIRDAFERYEGTKEFPEGVSMDDFINAGAIRFGPEAMSFMMAQKPTSKQLAQIDNLLQKNSEQPRNKIQNPNIELMSDAEEWMNREYSYYGSWKPEEADVKNIKKLINAFYEGEGITPAMQNFLAQGKKANGFYDPELGVIVLGRNMNEMTLPHEMQHYWLDKIFSIYKRAKAGELKVRDEWMTETKELFGMLGIDENQTQLTEGQQEKFARMSEAYLTGMGVSGDMNATFKEYQHWIPEKYKSMMNLAYKDDNGKIVLPYLDQAAVDFFNKWYANYSLPSLATSPERQEFINPEDENGEVLPVSIKEMNNRDKEFGVDAEEQVKTDQRLYNTLDENMPAEIKIESDGQKVVQESRSNFLKESEKQQRRWFERKSRDTEAQLAQDYIEKNPEHAKEVVYGDPELVPNDTGIDRATLINAYMALNKITPESEDWATLQTNIAINQSLAGTQLALSNNTSYRTYLDALREIENAREMKVATNYAGAKQGAVERFNRDIQRFVDQELPKVLATAPNSQAREIALKSLFEMARTKFSGNTTGGFLNQMDLDFAKAQKGASAAFTRWAINQIKKDAGAKLNNQEQAKLLEISAKAQQAVTDLDDRNIGKAVAGAVAIREWQVEKDKLSGVSPEKFSLFGDWAPRAMLASFNTLVVSNIPSTAMNTLVVRMLESGVFGENNVSKSLTDSEIKRIKAIYGASAMNLAQMEKPTSPSLLHGEKYSSSGQKWYDPFTILGKEDNWFRVPTFVNTLARIATQDAKTTGRDADEVFKEYCRLENQSDEAKLARKQALAVSNMAVFTQDGGLARALNGIRDWLNKGSRTLIGLDPKGFGLGNLLSPFLKTGANIAEMGIRGSIAPITTISALVQSWRSGKAIDPMKKLALKMDWTYFVLSSLAVALLSALTSDDDEFYTDPYETGKAYDPNKPYDSINIAGVWIDLDFFGPFTIPIRTGCKLVKQWKTDNLSAIYKGYGQGLKYAAMDTPLLQEIFNNQMSYATKKPEDWATGLAYNQVNKLIPAQIKPLSRAISRSEGIEAPFNDFSVFGMNVPASQWKVIKKKVQRNYGFDGAELTTQDLIDIFTTKITWQP